MFITASVISSIRLRVITGMRLLGGGAIGLGRTLWCIPFSGSGQIWSHLAPYLQCEPHLSPGGSGVLSDPANIDEEFCKAWLPYFCRSGQREGSLEGFAVEVDGWLSLLPEVHLPRLTGLMLADVVRREGRHCW